MADSSSLPPPPTNAEPGSYAWRDYQIKLYKYIAASAGSIPWANVSKTGSNLTDIATRTHNSLQAIAGGAANDYSHLTAAQAATVATLTATTYTPTLTNAANLDASTAYVCNYMRVGSMVTVSGRVDVDPTTTATTTTLGISLPIASTLAATSDCAGTSAASGISGQSAAILADTTNHRAQLQFKAVDTTNQAMYFTFTYRII